jgi:hypothetical protein
VRRVSRQEDRVGSMGPRRGTRDQDPVTHRCPSPRVGHEQSSPSRIAVSRSVTGGTTPRQRHPACGGGGGIGACDGYRAPQGGGEKLRGGVGMGPSPNFLYPRLKNGGIWL